MAQFDESKVINTLHPEKAEVGKKYFFTDSLRDLKECVEGNNKSYVFTLEGIDTEGDRIFEGGSYRWEFLYPYEEPPKQRMSNRQFCEWYSRGNGQWKWKGTSQCHIDYTYFETNDNKEVDDDIVIRSWDSEEWIEPTYEVYLRDCKGVTQEDIDDVAYRDGC